MTHLSHEDNRRPANIFSTETPVDVIFRPARKNPLTVMHRLPQDVPAGREASGEELNRRSGWQNLPDAALATVHRLSSTEIRERLSDANDL
jgi:hypothetical protein